MENKKIIKRFKIELWDSKTNSYGYSEPYLVERVYKNSLRAVLKYFENKGKKLKESDVERIERLIELDCLCITSYNGSYKVSLLKIIEE